MTTQTIPSITSALITLLQSAMNDAGCPEMQVQASPLGPGEKGIDFILTSIQENRSIRNYAAIGKESTAPGAKPMQLNLYYQLSAQWIIDGKQDVLEEQKSMGIAMNAFYENPILILSKDGSDSVADNHNSIRVTQMNLSLAESAAIWLASQRPMRPSVYYEVAGVSL